MKELIKAKFVLENFRQEAILDYHNLSQRNITVEEVINEFDKAPYYHGFHDDHHDNPLLTKKTKSEPIMWDIDDEIEDDDDSSSQATNNPDVEGVFQEMGFLIKEAIDSYRTSTLTAESEGKDDYNDDTKTSIFKLYQRGDHKDVYLEEQTGMRCCLCGVVLVESKYVIPKLANITPDKSEVQMSEFEDVVRMSEDLSAVIQTIDVVKGALSVAKSWLTKSKPFLASDLGLMPVSNSLLRVDTLKNLVSESMSLKFPVEEWSLLENVLASFMQWETTPIVH
nr:ARID DNA-binding domain-containing protein [Tanacetum cinerariifolium]